MIRRFKVGYDARAAQAHARARPAVADRARTRRRSPASSICRGDEHAQRRRRVRRHRRAGRAHDVGVDLICDAADTEALGAALRARGATPVSRAGRRVPARRARAPPLRDRPRRHRDPPGGGPERARGELHQGLLRRPGDGRAPLLQGQAQPAPARAARCPRRPRRAISCCSASGRWAASASAAVSPRLGPIALALVRREAEPGSVVSVGERGVSAEVARAAVRASAG